MLKRNVNMSASGRGTSHYRRAPEHCLTRALLVTHPHPVVARTSPGQLQIVRLDRGRIHERRHPASRSVAELPRKERRTTSVSVIGGHRVQDGITNIIHRLHQFLDRLFCARGRKALTQMVQTGASVVLPANPRCILRARHDHLPLLTQLTGVKTRMKRPFMSANATRVYDSRNGRTPIFASKLRLRTLPRPILASGQTQSRIPAPLLGQR
jgi:hypothetical protein